MTTQQLPAESADASAGQALRQRVAANLARRRRQHGLSTDRLADLAGVAPDELRALEAGEGTPTLGLLWKMARTLGLPFAGLIGAEDAGGTAVIRAKDCLRLRSAEGAMTSRALYVSPSERLFEAYELRLAPRAVEPSDAHAAGTTEHITVLSGSAVIVTGDGPFRLECGDVIEFTADVPHTYRNPTDVEAVLFLTMSYAEPVLG